MTKATVEQIRTLISYLPETTIEQRAAKTLFQKKLEGFEPDEVSHYNIFNMPVYTADILANHIVEALKSNFENNRVIIRKHLRQLSDDRKAHELLKLFEELSFNPMRAKRFEQLAQFLQNDNRDFEFLKRIYDENSQDLCRFEIDNKRERLDDVIFIAGFLIILSAGIITVAAIPALIALASFLIISPTSAVGVWICGVMALALLSILVVKVGMGIDRTLNEKLYPLATTEFKGEHTPIEIPSGNNKCTRASFWSKTSEHQLLMAFEPTPQELEPSYSV